MVQQERSDRQPQSSLNSSDYSWKLWPIVPIYPYGKRRTIRTEIVKDTIWTFDQIQGIFYVVVPIRMSVVRLAAGGLLVYAPVAPTPECIRLVKELVAEYGEVKYIILPTISAVEHKVFVPPFARKFPTASIFVAPNQWSFPVDLPLSWLGFPPHRTKILPSDSRQTPFADEFDYAILGDIDLNLGQFEEVVFLHRRSQTLLVTDSIVSIPEQPPEIVEQDLYPLLFHARDSAEEAIADTPGNRIKGWQRICLFAMYFRSSVLEVPKWREVFANALKSPNKSSKAYFGLFPFKWKSNWQVSFYALRGDGRILVAPILQTLILNRAPKETLAWADKIASWNFKRIIPCHFVAPIEATPQQFRQAFSFLEQANTEQGFIGSNLHPLPEKDFEALKDIDKALYQPGIVPPPKEKV